MTRASTSGSTPNSHSLMQIESDSASRPVQSSWDIWYIIWNASRACPTCAFFSDVMVLLKIISSYVGTFLKQQRKLIERLCFVTCCMLTGSTWVWHIIYSIPDKMSIRTRNLSWVLSNNLKIYWSAKQKENKQIAVIADWLLSSVSLSLLSVSWPVKFKWYVRKKTNYFLGQALTLRSYRLVSFVKKNGQVRVALAHRGFGTNM